MNDKTKKIIILILFILIVIVSILLISNYLTEKKTFDKNITFQLNGDENVTVYVDSVYNDLGFIARNKDGIDLSHKVKVSGNVDTSLNGEYIITYSLIDDNGILKIWKYMTSAYTTLNACVTYIPTIQHSILI